MNDKHLIISDIKNETALIDFNTIHFLSINNCENLKHIEFRNDLSQIKGIIIYENKVLEDINFYCNLDSLVYLEIVKNSYDSNCNIILNGSFKSLKEFFINNNKIEKFLISTGTNLNKLEELSFTNNNTKSFLILSKLPNIFSIDISNNELIDFTLNDNIRYIVHLFINNNKLKTLNFTVDLPLLRNLQITNNFLEYIFSNYSLKNLEILIANDNKLIDIQFNIALKKIKLLNIKNNPKLIDKFDFNKVKYDIIV